MNAPAATSNWQRLATRVRGAIAGVRNTCAVTAAVQEYSRVIPVLAGQVREAMSHLGHTNEAFEWLHGRSVDNAHHSREAAGRIEDTISALKVITLRLDEGAQNVVAIRRLVADLQGSLTPAMGALRQSAEADLAAAHEIAQLAETRAGQRLQNVIDTLSEMQDEFVTALEQPQKPTEPAGSAARRLRQRYTATAAGRTTA